MYKAIDVTDYVSIGLSKGADRNFLLIEDSFNHIFLNADDWQAFKDAGDKLIADNPIDDTVNQSPVEGVVHGQELVSQRKGELWRTQEQWKAIDKIRAEKAKNNGDVVINIKVDKP